MTEPATEAVASTTAKPSRPKAVLTDDLTITEVTAVLETLPFGRGPTRCLLSVDRGVRDYLVRAIKQR